MLRVTVIKKKEEVNLNFFNYTIFIDSGDKDESMSADECRKIKPNSDTFDGTDEEWTKAGEDYCAKCSKDPDCKEEL